MGFDQSETSIVFVTLTPPPSMVEMVDWPHDCNDVKDPKVKTSHGHMISLCNSGWMALRLFCVNSTVKRELQFTEVELAHRSFGQFGTGDKTHMVKCFTFMYNDRQMD